MTSYYIDQIRFDDLEEALTRLEKGAGDRDLAFSIACEDIVIALGGQRGAAAMIRYLIKQETTRLSNPRSS
jgi:hypothetical protein